MKGFLETDYSGMGGVEESLRQLAKHVGVPEVAHTCNKLCLQTILVIKTHVLQKELQQKLSCQK
eukprot:3074233-Amphidinium_carterae.1